MSERDFMRRYAESRAYADGLAKRLVAGELLHQWRYKWEYFPDQPEPPRETLSGPHVVAWAYEIAGRDATILMKAKGAHWQVDVDNCRQLQSMYEQRGEHE